jgi:hypothetical protein
MILHRGAAGWLLFGAQRLRFPMRVQTVEQRLCYGCDLLALCPSTELAENWLYLALGGGFGGDAVLLADRPGADPLLRVGCLTPEHGLRPCFTACTIARRLYCATLRVAPSHGLQFGRCCCGL